MEPTNPDGPIETYQPQANINESKAEKPNFGKDNSISTSQTGIITSKVIKHDVSFL